MQRTSYNAYFFMLRGCVQTSILHSLLQFEPANAQNLIKSIILLQHRSPYMFRALLAHHQKEHNCTKQLQELVCRNIIVIWIQLCAFIGSNCNNWIIIHGRENAKCYIMFSYGASNCYVKQSRMRRSEMNVGSWEMWEQTAIIRFGIRLMSHN